MREQRRCSQAGKCPLASSPTCLNPPREYLDLKTGKPAGECLFCHLLTAAELWRQASKRNLRPLLRLLSKYVPTGELTPKRVSEVVESAILLHDVGKLCEQYYQPRWGFRHEFLSAHSTLEFARDPKNPVFSSGMVKLAPVVAGAVLLHHESRLMRMLWWTGDIELGWEHVEHHVPPTMEFKTETIASFKELLRATVGYAWGPNEKYTQEEVMEGVLTILGCLNYRPGLSPYFARALVGAIVNVISVSDSLSAQRTRAGTSDEQHLSMWRELLSRWGRGFT